MTYPTWRKINDACYVSQEARDGAPDFRLVRDRTTKLWHVSWRTSAHWSANAYHTAQEAMAAITRALAS